MMPWPLTRAELRAAAGPLRAVSVEHLMVRTPLPHWRAEFTRD
jgi:hypothetical protein